MKNIVVVLLLLFFPTFLFSQTIEGKVVDEKGVALIGANVTNTTSSSSTSTDLDGNFKLKANQGDNLKVTMIGFATKMVKASSKMSIVLVEEANTLSDVVVIGYGTRKKVDNTTSISSLKAEDITKTKVLNASQAIQGKAAGVNVIASDLPGSTPTVIIRGIGTAQSDGGVLFVVDGMPQANINNINNNDIATYEILKDASALAIYGNRAANGVVIITTKQGKGNHLKVEFESFVGFRKPQSVVKMAGSNEYSHYSNVALQSTTFSQDQSTNTDWFKTITRTGNYSQNNLSLSGATESIKYFFSLGNYEEKSILKGSDYSRLTFRNNNEYKISNKIKLAQTLTMGYNHITPKPLSAFTSAYKQSPIVPVYFNDNLYGTSYVGANGYASETGSSFNNVGNPLAQINQNNEQQKNLQIQGGLKLDIELLKHLKYTSNFSGDYTSGKSYIFDDSRNNWIETHPGGSVANYTGTYINTLDKKKYTNFNWNFSNYLTFNKVFNTIHDVELTGGVESSSKFIGESTEFQLKNVDENPNYWTLYDQDYTSSVIKLVNNVTNERRLSSYFGRFQYKLMNKYLVTGTIRRDGSSQFAKDYQWGTFKSFGLGWIVSNEKFMENSKINLLKLRGGWGELGNQGVPLNTQNYTSGLPYYLGGSTSNIGTTINSAIDPKLSWEVTKETSAGIDFETFSKRLKGTIDVYNKETTNVVLNVLPYITSGFSVAEPSHVGSVTNKGYELSLRWDDKINDNINYFVSGNFSTNKNKLASLNDSNLSPIRGGGLGNGQYTKLLDNSTVGEALGSFYLYDYAGFDQATGAMLYYKADGTTTTQAGLADSDRKYMGTFLPTSNYGISVGMNYKNFDFSVDTYGTLGSKVYNGKKAQRFSGENVEESLATNFWSANNTSGSTPGAFNQVPVASSYYLESGDFFRIQNISIGYKIPLKSNTISFARVYCNAINPFIVKKFSGFTPELNGDGQPYGTQGIELDAYPTLKSVVFGLNLKF